MFIKVSGTSDWQQEGIKKVSTSNVYIYIINVMLYYKFKNFFNFFYVRMTIKLSYPDSNKIV